VIREKMKNKTSISVSVLSILIMVALSATATAQPVPPGFFISGQVNDVNGEPLNNGLVTVTNTHSFNFSTGGYDEVYSTQTGQLFWWANCRFIIPSDAGAVSPGVVLGIDAYDSEGNNHTYTEHLVTQDDIFHSGFVLPNITLRGMCGDVNRDGYVDMVDALAARNHWAFGIPLISEWAADVNCDGDIDFADAIAIRNHWGYIIPLDGCC